MNKKRILHISVFVLAVATVASLAFGLKGCYSTTRTRTFFAADTVCTITLYNGNESDLDGAVALVNKLSADLNAKTQDSQLGKLNSLGYSQKLSDDLAKALEYGLHYSEASGGIFDITVKPLTDLWDFKNQTVPTKQQIDTAKLKVGYKNIHLKGNTAELKNGAQIDLGAIAKGYIADQVVQFLIKQGVSSAMINLGGNVSVIGKKQGKHFSVGIQMPFSNEIAVTVMCNDVSVVTSGTYQRYFEVDGKQYHHLLDLKSGMPAENSLASVTIISKNATRADALSTLCFLLGKEKGIEWIENTPDTEAVFIDKNNEMHFTSGLVGKNSVIQIAS